MLNPEPTKVLFRCLLAYSNGRNVVSYELEENHWFGDETVCEMQNSTVALKVAVPRGCLSPHHDFKDQPGLLAAAYERFTSDGGDSDIEWVQLEEKHGSK